MEKTFQLLLGVLFFLVSSSLNAQDLIKNFDGIPVRAGLDWWWIDGVSINNREEILNKMNEMGVDIVQLDVKRTTILDTLRQKGFNIMPINSPSHKWIQYYTDAKYSVWEAEGTPPNVSEAKLEYSSNIMEKIDSGGISYLKLLSSAAAYSDSELIKGPYYQQEVLYYTTEPNSNLIDTVEYRVIFKLKLEVNSTFSDTVNPSTPLFKLQVTQSKLATPNNWTFECTYPILDSIITRANFDSINIFKDLVFEYRLDCDSCSGGNPTPPESKSYVETYNGTEQIQARWLREYIQFKVIWLGNPNYLLSIDKVIVSDKRGRQLFVDPDTLFNRSLIVQQANSLSAYNNNITGWLGIDEPLSIDNFEPIRLVTQILDDNSNQTRPVWFDLMSHWDGVWENKNNPFGVMHLSPWSELKKRTGRMSICQNAYMYDLPYLYNYGVPGYSCGCDDFRIENIRVAAEENFKQAYALDNYYGASLQCGEIHRLQANQKNPLPQQILYSANLALLYGAKWLSLYSYLAQVSTDSCDYNPNGKICHALVDILPNGGGLFYTDKWHMWKNTLNPRLHGLFGKTLKTLIPDTQFVAWRGINAVDSPYVNYPAGVVKKIEPRYGADGDEKCFIELGFFHKPNEYNKRYFMFLNRYYSNVENLKFTLKNLYSYKNWNLTDYVENRTTYFTADANSEAVFYDTIPRGDARLYSIAPTIVYGGTLNCDETLQNSTTLQGDLIVNPGVTLTINNSLTSYGDIRLKNGAKLRTTNNELGGS